MTVRRKELHALADAFYGSVDRLLDELIERGALEVPDAVEFLAHLQHDIETRLAMAASEERPTGTLH